MATTILDDLLPSEPKKRRTDKPATSGAPRSVSAVARHYNQLPQLGVAARRQSRIFHQRNLNNWVKSVIIGKFAAELRRGAVSSEHQSALCVFDMCCGKGGDALKWKKARVLDCPRVQHLLCADVAEASLEQCQNRHTDMRRRERNPHNQMFTADYLHADCTRDIVPRLTARLKRSGYQHLDLTSCQFALHYGFESLDQARAMVRNACDLLRPGGYFIGSVPNADVIVVWNCPQDKPALFGEQFNFKLHEQVDCPEYLAHFPLIVKLATECDMELVWHETFPGVLQSYINKPESSEFQLLK